MLACGISLTLTATGFGTHGGAAPAGVSPAMRNTAQSFCERNDRSTPPEVNCKLVFSEVTFSTANAEGPMTFKTRGYNADSPLGPTIRVKPGDLLKVARVAPLAPHHILCVWRTLRNLPLPRLSSSMS